MKYIQIKSSIQKHWLVYFLTILIAFIMRNFCKTNDSNALIWILAPTSRWVSVLSGISFEYLPHRGYASHLHQFLIAPSCSGIRFMLLTYLMLIFSFLYQICSKRKGYLWFLFSIAFSYIATIFVNAGRIIASIYLPLHLNDLRLMGNWLNPDRLHTIIGTTIYFASLCIIYLSAAFICKRVFLDAHVPSVAPRHSKSFAGLSGSGVLIVPAFWYLLIVLALPFLKRVLCNEWSGFGQYALLIVGVCFSVIILLHLIQAVRSCFNFNIVKDQSPE